ncbi:hypothetical protein [Halorussus pelagicus]|uniref:hypothetical protein n=1 Tax=Halorussus pelagicus TaxID=2505977 RepID=UPI001FB7C51C|nr:hypothetical protein [Halorussus pelagicus]
MWGARSAVTLNAVSGIDSAEPTMRSSWFPNSTARRRDGDVPLDALWSSFRSNNCPNRNVHSAGPSIADVNRVLRYAVALLVAAAVTGGVASVTQRSAHQLLLLTGIAQVYAVGTAIALRYPYAVWRSGENWVSAAFAGVTTFGVVMLLAGIGSEPNLAAAALGWSLAVFGFVVGIVFERERNTGPQEA